MPKFHKKPVVIEAVRWTGTNLKEIEAFYIGAEFNVAPGVIHREVFIRTLEGTMIATEGDWIIRGVRGEFYPIKNDIFLETYEAITSGEPAMTDPQRERATLLAREFYDDPDSTTRISRLTDDELEIDVAALADLLLDFARGARLDEATGIGEPYPEDVFTPLTEVEMAHLQLALKHSNISNASDRLHASWARYLSETRIAQLQAQPAKKGTGTQ